MSAAALQIVFVELLVIGDGLAELLHSRSDALFEASAPELRLRCSRRHAVGGEGAFACDKCPSQAEEAVAAASAQKRSR